MAKRNYPNITMEKVAITGGFWMDKMNLISSKTIQAVYDRSKETGRIDAFSLNWKPGLKPVPHKFWDSDVAKWVEAVAYSLKTHPDEDLKKKLESVITLIINAQQPDGYLNSYFTQVRPQDRWINLRDDHELYCAGHLMEAAVALKEQLDDERLIVVMEKYSDYIASVFGVEEEKLRGYPGHEEIELALMRMYKSTNKEKFLKLATYFVNERGQEPYYFNIEAKKRGEKIKNLDYLMEGGFSRNHDYLYSQAYTIPQDQDEAHGHCVRACYFYSGMADVAMETRDSELLNACKLIWEDIALKKMYITGGLGSSHKNEGFTYPYDLPNETSYAETCAAIAWLFFNHRMLQAEMDGKYADMMERALYNGILSGLSLDGERFFYVNPLSFTFGKNIIARKHATPERQKFFNTSCCPPNIARLFASIPSYFYTFNGKDLAICLYGSNKLTLDKGIQISEETNYPWDGNVKLKVEKNPDSENIINIFLRIPEWCKKHEITLNGKNIEREIVNGYIEIEDFGKVDDEIILNLYMKPIIIRAHPEVKENLGRVALQRGPIVYCFEAEDNEDISLHGTFLRSDEKIVEIDKRIQDNNLIALKCKGASIVIPKDEWKSKLYSYHSPIRKDVDLIAIPYFAWANRNKADMLVWINES